MQRVIKSLLLTVLLVSCSTDNDPRYQDTSYLERPPTLSTNPNYNGESYTADTSRIEKKSTVKGLGDEVYLTSTNPVQLKIKQPVDQAWSIVRRGLQQTKDVKIVDHDRNKKFYQVIYKTTLFGFIEGAGVSYQINLKSDANETSVSAKLSSEQNTGSDSYDDDSEKLLNALYETLHDTLQAE